MIVKVSKVMAKFLNENLNLNCVESISYGICQKVAEMVEI